MCILIVAILIVFIVALFASQVRISILMFAM